MRGFSKIATIIWYRPGMCLKSREKITLFAKTSGIFFSIISLAKPSAIAYFDEIKPLLFPCFFKQGLS
ncbi:hypothetical protein BGS_0573 [Beggiatoa sp. SS]|nr:hypothetical protein BGS_0573 [Beggiatoa sp. SS]